MQSKEIVQSSALCSLFQMQHYSPCVVRHCHETAAEHVPNKNTLREYSEFPVLTAPIDCDLIYSRQKRGSQFNLRFEFP